MMRKTYCFCLVALLATIDSSCAGFASTKEKEGKTMREDNCIKKSMTLNELKKTECKDFIEFSENKIAHKIKDNRLRYYYRYKPLMLVAMREIDINSYFELVFEDGVISEINQYRLNGDFIQELNKIYCWRE